MRPSLGLKFITDKKFIMNWGYKIMIVFAVFVSGIMFLVIKSSEQKMDLVTTDYYGKELKYQQQIDAMNHVSQLSDTIVYALHDGQLKIVFPKDFTGKKLDGRAVLYCPADENMDITHAFSVKDNAVTVPVSKNKLKWFDLQLSWDAEGTSYYLEKKLFIN